MQSSRTVIGIALLLMSGFSAHAQLPCPPAQLQQWVPDCGDSIFFQSVCIADNQMVVGRYTATGGRVEAYDFDAPTMHWNLFQVLEPQGLDRHDSFGQWTELGRRASDGAWLLVAGNPIGDTQQPRSGTAYIYDQDMNGSWALQAELAPTDPIANETFGNSATWATSGVRTLLVVGAPGSEGLALPGHAYVFEQDGNGVWQQQTQLSAPDGGQSDGAFGWSTDAAESHGVTVLAVSEPVFCCVRDVAPGTVWFYRFEPATSEWVLEADFQAPDPYEQDFFGWSVSVGAVTDEPGITHRVVVGRPNDGGFGNSEGPGAAFVYVRDDSGTWRLEQRIDPPYSHLDVQQFGLRVDLEKEGASKFIVGGPSDGTFGQYAGSAFVFERDQQNVWTPIQRLDGQDEDSGDAFGWGVALGNGSSDGTAVVGAIGTQCPGGDRHDTVGAVYSFDLNPGGGGACPAPVIRLQKVPDCSSGPGGQLEVRWFQATPDQSSRIALLYGKRTGHFAIPNGNPCAGLQLGLGSQGLQVAYFGPAGQFGAGRLKTNIPRVACGGYLQLLDLTRCELSNVVRIQ